MKSLVIGIGNKSNIGDLKKVRDSYTKPSMNSPFRGHPLTKSFRPRELTPTRIFPHDTSARRLYGQELNCVLTEKTVWSRIELCVDHGGVLFAPCLITSYQRDRDRDHNRCERECEALHLSSVCSGHTMTARREHV